MYPIPNYRSKLSTDAKQNGRRWRQGSPRAPRLSPPANDGKPQRRRGVDHAAITTDEQSIQPVLPRYGSRETICGRIPGTTCRDHDTPASPFPSSLSTIHSDQAKICIANLNGGDPGTANTESYPHYLPHPVTAVPCEHLEVATWTRRIQKALRKQTRPTLFRGRPTFLTKQPAANTLPYQVQRTRATSPRCSKTIINNKGKTNMPLLYIAHTAQFFAGYFRKKKKRVWGLPELVVKRVLQVAKLHLTRPCGLVIGSFDVL